MPTRRQVLAGIVGTGVFVGAASGLSWFKLGYELRQGEVPIALTRKEFVVVRTLVEALLPGDGDLPSGVDLGVPQRLDHEVWAAPEAVASDLKASLLLLEHAAPWFGYAGRFSSLPLGARQRILREMLAADTDVFVQTVMAWKQMAHLFYYADEALWPSIGYQGPWIDTPRPPPTATTYEALLAEARDA